MHDHLSLNGTRRFWVEMSVFIVFAGNTRGVDIGQNHLACVEVMSASRHSTSVASERTACPTKGRADRTEKTDGEGGTNSGTLSIMTLVLRCVQVHHKGDSGALVDNHGSRRGLRLDFPVVA